MAAGMALAEKFLATKYNKEGYNIVDHYTFVLCGDGDMQEGVTYEAASLAGHLSLGKLIVLYDANQVTLDGPLSMSFKSVMKQLDGKLLMLQMVMILMLFKKQFVRVKKNYINQL